MYANFVRNRSRRAFADLSAGRVGDHIARFHDEARLRIDRDGMVKEFAGKTEIEPALREEFGETGRHAFEISDILVRGGPWNTRIAVLWRDRGGSGPRRGMNHIRLRWGRVVDEFLFAGTVEREGTRDT